MKRKNDEMYTPPILAQMILPYVKNFISHFFIREHRLPTIWCPFDTPRSEFVKMFSSLTSPLGDSFGAKFIPVEFSHISSGGDFFQMVEDENFLKKISLVISNPPFSRKLEVFQKLNEKNIPYALLCNTEALNYQEIGEYFISHPMSFIIPDKKVSFDGNTSSFNTSYFCSPSFFGIEHEGIFLPTIKFIHLPHNNTKENFVGSEMGEDLKEEF